MSTASTAIRALTMFETLPYGHVLFSVTTGDSSPHLQFGEYAVIDETDREPVHGELYLLQWRSGARKRTIMQARADRLKLGGRRGLTDCWWISPLVRPKTKQEFEEWARGGRVIPLSDGPYETGHLKEYIVGRVVGVAFKRIGEVLAQQAGWLDEEGGNARFDAAEFIDVHERTGHKVYACFDSKGGAWTMIQMPGLEHRPETDEEREEIYRVCRLRNEASRSGEMIIAECRRRGLVYGAPQPS